MPLDFVIDLSRLTRPGIVQASPAGGRVGAGERAVVKLRVSPGVPDRLMELVVVRVAHFEPVQVQVLVEGTYPRLTLGLPRVRDALFAACADEAREAPDEGLRATTIATLGAPPGGGRAAAVSAAAAAAAAARPASGSGVAVAKSVAAGRAPSIASSRPVGTVAAPSVAGSGRKTPGPGSVASGAARSQAASVAPSARSRASSAASNGATLARDRLAQLAAELGPEKRADLEAERARLVHVLLDPACAEAAAAEVAAMVAAAQEAAAAALLEAQRRRRSTQGSALSDGDGGARSEAGESSSGGSRDGGGNGHGGDGGSVHSGSGGGGDGAGSEKAAAAATAAALRRLPPPPKLPPIASAHYVLDFGFAAKGVNRTRKVKVTNASVQQIQVAIERPALEAFGFGVGPDASFKLAGAPECQSTELTFSLLAAKASVQPGPAEVTVPLAVRGGCAANPAVLVTLKAHIVMPEVEASATALDFGTVTHRNCKVVTVQLRNPRQVPAEWSIKRPVVDSPKLHDWGFFVAEPAEGTLEPGGAANVRVTFTPQAGRESLYSVALPVRVANNPRPLELACSGRGFTPRVEVAPAVVDCGPALPAFPGQRPAEAAFVITNPTDRPVEVVCVELDARLRADEEALRSLGGDNDMCARLWAGSVDRLCGAQGGVMKLGARERRGARHIASKSHGCLSLHAHAYILPPQQLQRRRHRAAAGPRARRAALARPDPKGGGRQAAAAARRGRRRRRRNNSSSSSNRGQQRHGKGCSSAEHRHRRRRSCRHGWCRSGAKPAAGAAASAGAKSARAAGVCRVRAPNGRRVDAGRAAGRPLRPAGGDGRRPAA